MESRYTNRFRSLGDRTGAQIKNQDAAGNLTEIITQARGSLSAQKQNTADLFSTAVEMITSINTHQQMMDVELVKNLPLPNPAIRSSPAKQLGYVQLTMRFLQAGLLHFMETTSEAQHRITTLEKMLEQLAQYDGELDVLGEMTVLDIDSLDLQDARPLSPPASPPADLPAKARDVPVESKPKTPTQKTASNKSKPSK